MARIISFDLDGTLVDWTFADAFWFDCMARLYSQRWGLSFPEALREVKRKYDEVGMDNLAWYNIDYWWKKFGFEGSWRELIEECRGKVRPYPDAREALERLHRKFKLIVITNGIRELAEVEVRESGFERYFDRVFSATTDFGLVKKTGDFYLKILAEIGASADEVVHIGDNYIFDFLAPREAGIRAFFLDREGKHSGDFVVRDLLEFSRRMLL
ncbi:MAG: HAD family hydrolase [Hadesarchaea archaeon]|nr:HAD family hydrolase [Hadesarchaea archaeon]